MFWLPCLIVSEKLCFFSIQLDDATDIAQKCNLVL